MYGYAACIIYSVCILLERFFVVDWAKNFKFPKYLCGSAWHCCCCRYFLGSYNTNFRASLYARVLYRNKCILLKLCNLSPVVIFCTISFASFCNTAHLTPPPIHRESGDFLLLLIQSHTHFTSLASRMCKSHMYHKQQVQTFPSLPGEKSKRWKGNEPDAWHGFERLASRHCVRCIFSKKKNFVRLHTATPPLATYNFVTFVICLPFIAFWAPITNSSEMDFHFVCWVGWRYSFYTH